MAVSHSVAAAVAQASGKNVTNLPFVGAGGGDAADPYAANGFDAPLAADFAGTLNSGTPFYRKQGSTCELADFGFPERSGLATLVNASGNLVWTAHNLAVNSETPATQSITVVSGGEYTVEMEGAGSFALTGAGTGTASDGSPATITASTTTLTITLTGAADRVWVYRSDLGGMDDVEASYRTAGAPANYLATTGTARYLPRFGNHRWNGSAWVPAGVLVEREARTNLQTESSDFSAWAESDATLTGGQTGALGLGAYSLVENGATTNHRMISPSWAFSSGTQYCAWAIAEPLGSGSKRYLQILISGLAFDAVNNNRFANFDVELGTVTLQGADVDDSGIFEIDDGRYLCYVVSTAAASSSGGHFVSLLDSGTGGRLGAYAGDTSSGLIITASQIEEGATPSSYIPTNGTATARTADPDLTVLAADAPYSASGLSLAVIGDVTYADEDQNSQQRIWAREADTQNRCFVNLRTSAGTGDAVFYTEENNVNYISQGNGSRFSPGISVPVNIASRHSTTDTQGAVGGAAETSAGSAPATMPDLSAADLDIASTNFMGNIARVVGWSEDIGEAGIIQSSTEDNTAP